MKWGKGGGLVCSLCSCTICTIIGNPLLCIQPHEILTMHRTECVYVCMSPPLVASSTHPPTSLPRLLLTLVYPEKPFILKQFRALRKHLFRISTLGDLTQTAAACN